MNIFSPKLVILLLSSLFLLTTSHAKFAPQEGEPAYQEVDITNCACPVTIESNSQTWSLIEPIPDTTQITSTATTWSSEVALNVPPEEVQNVEDEIYGSYPTVIQRNYTSIFPNYYPSTTGITCETTTAGLDDPFEWYEIYNDTTLNGVYTPYEKVEGGQGTCHYCNEENTEYNNTESQIEVPELFHVYTCESDVLGSEELCLENNGVVLTKVNNCCRESSCFINTCSEKDTPFPNLAENEKTLYSWSIGEDRNDSCLADSGYIQEATLSCKQEYRCVKETESLPIESCEPISSYVTPRNGIFHEDISLDGADFGLHYASSDIDSTSIAHGWNINVYTRLDGDRLHYGNGSVMVVDISTVEGDLTVILSDTSEMLFDPEGKLQNIRDLYTKETKLSFTYDALANLTTIADRYGEVTTIERNAEGIVTAVVAPTGQRTLLNIDDNGDLIEVQYEDTSSYSFEYERHLMTVETEPNGNRFLHFFDDNDKVVKVIDAEQGEWLFGSNTEDTYGSHTVTRADGDVVTYISHFLENNSTILWSEKVLPTGDMVEYLNATDDTIDGTRSCGVITINFYKTENGVLYKDPFTQKRVLEEVLQTTPSGLQKTTLFTKSYRLDDNGTVKNIYTTKSVNQNISKSKRDYERYRAWTTSPLGKKYTTTYDNKNQNVLSKDPYAVYKTTYTYDAEGRVTEEKTGYRVTSYAYDAKGNLQDVTDPLGRVTTYLYDSRDRVSQVTYPDGSTEYFAYDSNSNLITRTVPTPADHSFNYNGVSKRVSNTSPLQKQTTYTYDKQRRVIQVTKPSGNSIDTVYAYGRVESIQTPEGTANYSYSCQSNVSNITKNSESIDFSYDGTLLINMSYTGVLNESISYVYNNDFLPTSISYSGATEVYGYNADNELISSGEFSISRRSDYGLKKTLTDGSYIQESDYNLYGELANQSDGTIDLELERNKAGQITKKVETIDSNESSHTYQYDDRGRLTAVRANRKLIEKYSYDLNGNRATATVSGVTIAASYTLDDNLVVYGDNTYRYNDDGYLEEKITPEGITNYEYGTLGELLSVTTLDKTITYLQNANNQRVAKLVDGEIIEKYLWLNLTTLLAVYDAEDNLVERFEYADQRMPVAMTDANGTKYYLHYDQVGTLKAVSDIDHKIVKLREFDTFGKLLSDSNESFEMPFGFAGGLYDQDTELTRFGYRDYDAFTGKWTAKDPIEFEGGDSNLYSYVLGDPVGFVDPEGKYGVPGAIGGAVVGFGMSFINPCTGEIDLPSVGDLILNTAAGGAGGFFGGFFAGSSTALGVIGGGIGSGAFFSTVSYSLAPECKEEPVCR